MEETLRQRTGVDQLMVARITTIPEGRELVDKINKFAFELLNEAREAGNFDNEKSKAYTDVRYDLRTARNNVQNQMTKLVKAKR